MKYTKHQKQTILIGVASIISFIISYIPIFLTDSVIPLIVWNGTIISFALRELYIERRNKEDKNSNI